MIHSADDAEHLPFRWSRRDERHSRNPEAAGNIDGESESEKKFVALYLSSTSAQYVVACSRYY